MPYKKLLFKHNRNIKLPHKAKILSLCVFAKSLIATGSKDGSIIVWEQEKG